MRSYPRSSAAGKIYRTARGHPHALTIIGCRLPMKAMCLLLKDVFIWAYERSAARDAAVRQSLGEPDPFRLRYREQLREFIAERVRARVGPKDAAARIAA